MKTLERKIIAAISAVLLLLVAAGVIVYGTITDSIETNLQVSNTHETLREVEATLSILKDAESSQRGYILAGRDDALEHLRTAREEAVKKLAHLKVLTAKNKGHQEKLVVAESKIHHKLDQIHRSIDLRKKEGFQAAKEEVLTDEEKEEMDNIRGILGGIADEEEAGLESRIALSKQGMQNISISFAGLFILILLLLALVFFLVKKDFATQRSLNEKLSDMATTDELTTLYNRREINRCFRDEVERFQRYEQPFSLLLIDIDHFKSVNDTHGHQVGDKVLQWIAMQIRDCVRSIDIAGRFGGEEFAVILPNTTGPDAYVIAERMRSAIANTPFRLEQPDNSTAEISVTVSIGVSVMADKYETEADIIRTADTALYQAKDEGRDRTVVFEQVAVLQ